MAKTIKYFSDFVCRWAKLTLVRRDAYLYNLKTGIKLDTLAALRNAPLHLATLFPDCKIRKTYMHDLFCKTSQDKRDHCFLCKTFNIYEKWFKSDRCASKDCPISSLRPSISPSIPHMNLANLNLHGWSLCYQNAGPL